MRALSSKVRPFRIISVHDRVPSNNKNTMSQSTGLVSNQLAREICILNARRDVNNMCHDGPWRVGGYCCCCAPPIRKKRKWWHHLGDFTTNLFLPPTPLGLSASRSVKDNWPRGFGIIFTLLALATALVSIGTSWSDVSYLPWVLLAISALSLIIDINDFTAWSSRMLSGRISMIFPCHAPRDNVRELTNLILLPWLAVIDHLRDYQAIAHAYLALVPEESHAHFFEQRVLARLCEIVRAEQLVIFLFDAGSTIARGAYTYEQKQLARQIRLDHLTLDADKVRLPKCKECLPDETYNMSQDYPFSSRETDAQADASIEADTVIEAGAPIQIESATVSSRTGSTVASGDDTRNGESSQAVDPFETESQRKRSYRAYLEWWLYGWATRPDHEDFDQNTTDLRQDIARLLANFGVLYASCCQAANRGALSSPRKTNASSVIGYAPSEQAAPEGGAPAASGGRAAANALPSTTGPAIGPTVRHAPRAASSGSTAASVRRHLTIQDLTRAVTLAPRFRNWGEMVQHLLPTSRHGESARSFLQTNAKRLRQQVKDHRVFHEARLPQRFETILARRRFCAWFRTERVRHETLQQRYKMAKQFRLNTPLATRVLNAECRGAGKEPSCTCKIWLQCFSACSDKNRTPWEAKRIQALSLERFAFIESTHQIIQEDGELSLSEARAEIYYRAVAAYLKETWP